MFTYPISGSAAAFVPTDISGLALWLDGADPGVTALTWDDKSGNNNHFVADAEIYMPPFADGAAIFATDGGPDFLTGPNIGSGWTTGEIFFLLKSLSIPETSGYNGFHAFGSPASQSHYPFGTTLYMGVGSTIRRSVSAPALMTDWHINNIHSTTDDYEMRLNGTPYITSGTNTPSWGNVTPTVGNKVGKGSGGNPFGGWVKSILLYDSILGTDDRAAVMAYLNGL